MPVCASVLGTACVDIWRWEGIGEAFLRLTPILVFALCNSNLEGLRWGIAGEEVLDRGKGDGVRRLRASVSIGVGVAVWKDLVSIELRVCSTDDQVDDSFFAVIDGMTNLDCCG